MKKYILLTLFSLVLSLNTKTYSYAQNFFDVSNNHWATNQINDFYDKGIINGYEDGSFNPNNKVTRAEFVKIINKAFDIDYINPTINTSFNDIKGHWAEQEIKMAVSNGVYDYVLDKSLNSKFNFRPNDPITREEASTMIATYLDLKDNKINKLPYFYDFKEVSYWAKTSMESLIEKGLIKGYKDKSINPKGGLTRAELVVLVDRIKNITNDYEEEIPVLMYHHFDDVSKFGAVVVKDEFIKQIDYLIQNGYNTITVKDLYEISIGEKLLPKKPIIISADDGYLSNYEFMYPELKKRNMEATIFVIGNDIYNADYNIQNNIGVPKFNWSQAKEMVDSGLIDIQSHTNNSHNKVSVANSTYQRGNFSTPLIGESLEDYKKRIDNDIKLSIKGIKENLGYTPVAFAYPFGEYSKISEKVLKENGIKISFTIKDGFVDIKDDLYLIDRVTVSGKDSFEDFKNKLNR